MAVGIAVAVRVVVPVGVAVMPGRGRDGGAVLAGKRADAVADAVLAVGELVLALLDSLSPLLAPNRRIEASRRRGAGDGDGGRRNGYPG